MAVVCDGTAIPSSKVIWNLWLPKCGTMPKRLGKVGLGNHTTPAQTSDPCGGRNSDQQLRIVRRLQNVGTNAERRKRGLAVFGQLFAIHRRYTFVFPTALYRALPCDRCLVITT